MEVILIAALTADGFIARETSQVSTAWTSKADRLWFAKTTKEIGVMVMGWNTFQTIGKPLPNRQNIVFSMEPEVSARQFQFPNLEFTNKDPKQLLAELEGRGYEQVAICGGSTIYTLFMKAKLVNRMLLTVEPVVFGAGLKLFNQSLHEFRLDLVNSQKLGEEGTILLEYNIR